MRSRACRAFSLIELLAVIGVIGILVGLLVVTLASAKAKSRQTACLNQLRQIGIGFGGYALNQDGKYPMDVAAQIGGSAEYRDSRVITNTSFSMDFHHFAAISNEVTDPKIMTCPGDRFRRPALSYASFTNENLSYWVNVRAMPYATASQLAGDWNIHTAGGGSNVVGTLEFDRQVHNRRGSVLFADGRVEITRSFAAGAPGKVEVASLGTSVSGRSGGTGQPAKPNSVTSPSATPPKQSAPGEQTGPRTSGASQSVIGNVATNSTGIQTNAIAMTAQPGGQARNSAVGWRRSDIDDNAPAQSPILSDALSSKRSARAGTATESDSPEWDTPGFRLFKLLAIASYLISLLWAILALLVLYLRSRIAQRQREKASAFPVE